jgi:DNA-directed RNA polymerase specialized sigma subunit
MPSWPLDSGGINRKGDKAMPARDTKEALKQLRQTRSNTIEQARKTIKAYNRRIAAIKSELTTETRTVPEIAQALGMETADVLVIVAALRKYGEVLEDVKAGDYFKYRLVGKAVS